MFLPMPPSSAGVSWCLFPCHRPDVVAPCVPQGYNISFGAAREEGFANSILGQDNAVPPPLGLSRARACSTRRVMADDGRSDS